MSAGHNILNDLLRAFTDNGPGTVRLIASSDGVRIPNERLIQIVIPTWGNANNILILPDPDPGKIVIIAGAATGGELRTTAPASIAINGVTGTGFESAISASVMAILICESPTNWKGFTISANGTPGQLAVPDA
jgi:hypothetical protein